MSRKVNKVVKLIAGLLIMVSLLCQLFTFEKFSAVITSAGIMPYLSLPIAIILVVVELTSLPFLIDMNMPKRITMTSKVAGFLSLGIMSVISFLAFMNGYVAAKFQTWLGWRDSNPRMAGPEPAALPLGDIPTANTIVL